MNKQYSIIAGFLLAVMVLAGCGGMSSLKEVDVEVLTPAITPLPSNIENLLIIDRTAYTGSPFDSNKAILTIPIPGETLEAVQAMVYFLQYYLGGASQLQSIVASETLAGNSFSGSLPPPIPWATVKDLCSRYQTDALLAIEVYRSDFNVSIPRPASSGQQSMYEDPRQALYAVRGSGNVVFGFRVYDPRTETIVDEERVTRDENWNAVGPDPASAMAGMIPRKQAIGDLIQLAGAEYSNKISPIYVSATRKYYSQSGQDTALAKGSQLAKEEKWREAADVWEAGISQASKSEAGQLAYNIAIAYEALRQPEKAREWAEKAAKEYGNGQAKDYLAALDGERSLWERAKEQVNTGGSVSLPGVQIQK